MAGRSFIPSRINSPSGARVAMSSSADHWLIHRLATFRRSSTLVAYLVVALLVFLHVIWQPLTTVAETGHIADGLREAELSLHATNRVHRDDGEHASSPDDER